MLVMPQHHPKTPGASRQSTECPKTVRKRDVYTVACRIPTVIRERRRKSDMTQLGNSHIMKY